MDCVIHGIAQSRTRLSDFHFASQPAEGGEGVPGEAACLLRGPPGFWREPVFTWPCLVGTCECWIDDGMEPGMA